ncbi:hypothetical protein GGI43DRAFT_426245 [Trichoderma evansii]
MTQNKWPLPTEITKHIIELTCWHTRGGQCYNTRWAICPNLPSIAQYACVCREWQDIVERQTFQNLRLDRARLMDVDHIVCQRRQAYPYGVELYGDVETAEENERNSSIFSETLWLGLDRVGITLCITAFSPSDVYHRGKAERRNEDIMSRDIGSNRYIHSILQVLPAATELPAVKSVSQLISSGERHISASAWALIINRLPNAKKINVDFWEKEKNLELRKRLRDEMGDALARIRCPGAEVTLSCHYKAPKNHASSPPTLVNACGADDAFTRGLRTWARQLKALYLSGVPHLEQLHVDYAAVTPHGTWLLERNPEDSPYACPECPSPTLDLDLWHLLMSAAEDLHDDLHEHKFRTVLMATEMDRLYRSAARAARRMPALRSLYFNTRDGARAWGHTFHEFLYKYDAIRGIAIVHWGSLPGYKTAEDVVALWREMANEVRGCELEVFIDENNV